MAPKGGDKQKKALAKAQEKKKEKVAEDKTFGLKNKNKSKVVQKKVNNIKQGATSQSEKQKRLEMQDGSSGAARKAKKAAEEARKRELAILFAEATSKADMKKVEGLLAQRGEEEKEEKLDLSEIEIPVEEWVEQERAKIENKTKLTEALFKQWRAKQMNERAKTHAEEKAKRAKVGGLSGRELFEKDDTLAGQDDGSGAAFDSYAREVDDEVMLAKAAKEAELLAQRVAAELGISVEELQTGKKPKEEEEGGGVGLSEAEKIMADLDDEDLDDEELAALEGEIANS